jgi:LysM repeat protein
MPTMHRVFSVFVSLLLLIAHSASFADSSSLRSQMAGISQRMEELERQYNLIKLEVDNLRTENDRLNKTIQNLQSAAPSKDLEAAFNSKLALYQKQTEQYIKDQYEKVISLISKKIDSVASAPVSIPQTVVSTPVQTKVSQPAIKDFPKEGGVLYTVVTGDTLSSIAKKHNSTVRYIQAANDISDPNTVKVGDKLFIPLEKSGN